ncbi:hypothetical protein KP79_PYT16296 [Mizuhopecten yessoensis]|uniref:Novel STAND NTPase 3 domain-containing protein n=1 Tax=Mizuhopecten yessoensis TaxID=6573 RepID=A0A210QHP1_MIZYE|nr:hypothetical protein KP79_PYT16296 [Mizuhopecten yessoensis]
MGVDLAVYRARIGQFVPRPVNGIVSNIDYLCKAIASVRGGLIRQDGLNSKGSVKFIDLLLRAQGIEPNPGPGKRSQRSVPGEQTEENDDVSIQLESNVNPINADMISRVMESFLPVSNPSETGSSQTDEYAGAVAIPGPSSGAIAKSTVVSQDSNVTPNSADRIGRVMDLFPPVSNPSDTESSHTDEYAGAVAIPGPSSGAIAKTTVVPQVVINCHVNKIYNKKICVENMRVKNAENVCTGEQTIIHTGQAGDNKDEDIPKQRKKSDKRILLEENTEVMLKRHIQETANLLVTRKGAVAAVVKRLKDYNMVVIAGVTGEGKTTLGREICKQLRDGTIDKDIKPKTPVLMTISQDWNDVVNDKDDIVVFVDDIFGKTNYQTGLLNGEKCLFGGNISYAHT